MSNNSMWQHPAPLDKPKGHNLDYWTMLHHQAAIAAMQGLISGGIYTSTIKLAQERGQNGTEFIVQMATEFADALVSELKRRAR